ncbi:nucleotide exchange factor GrpE [Alkalibaculum sp. M08DMB]|uniref:Protein GrpE n=1 Tax=Alkalibaculum sporogenes TaxID=2655001 RepID=A0A6A7K5A7_9FIRM|nr:nucleotide exchange factor GrpE [Alkalibaculum sporogenes]
MIEEELNEEISPTDEEKLAEVKSDIELEELEVEKADKLKDENANKLIRMQADFDNFRKRTIKEKEDIYKYALSDFAEKLLPVLDNMERALKSIEDANISDAYVDGVKMVANTLIDVLKTEGLEEVKADNTEFNPLLHHGVAVENLEEIEDNQVIEVYQKGYKFKDKIIRPAMVKICKK